MKTRNAPFGIAGLYIQLCASINASFRHSVESPDTSHFHAGTWTHAATATDVVVVDAAPAAFDRRGMDVDWAEARMKKFLVQSNRLMGLDLAPSHL